MLYVPEEDVLNLSGKAWVPLPRLSRVVPFGYDPSEEDQDVLLPNIFELEALEQAKKYRKKGYSYNKIRNWLVDVTGREISAFGLQKRIDNDSRRRSKAQAIANWARSYKEALQKAKALDERLGNDTGDYDEALRDLYRVSTDRGTT